MAKSALLPTGGRLILLGGVFVLKLLVVLQLRDHPLLQPDVGLDTTAYAELARKVVAGDLGLGPGLYYVSPLYIYFLAAGLALFDSFTAVRVLQALLGTTSVAFIFLSTREWFGERAAWIAAGLAAFTGLFTFYESLILQASIDAFLTAAALLCLTSGLRRSDRGLTRRHARPEGRAYGWRTLGRLRIRFGSHGGGAWLVAAGIIFGLASLNRPNMPLAVAGITMALLPGRRFGAAVLLVAGLIAGLAPAAIRNVVVAHQWTMVSSHGGLNFYIGNSATATGFFHEIPGITPDISGQEKDSRRVAEAAVGRPLTEAETSDYFFGLAWRWIREHPRDALALFAKKLAFVFSAPHIALPHSYPFYAYDSHTMLRFYAVGPWLLIPLGLAGLIFAAPREGRTEYLVWVSFVPAYAIGVAAFFVAERYRLPLLVPLCAGAGAALDGVMPTRSVSAKEAHAPSRGSRLIVPGVVFAILFAFVNWPHQLHDGRWEEGLRLAQRLVVLRRYDEAEHLVPVLKAHEPRPGVTDYAVGVQLLQANHTASAIAHLTKAQQLDPDQPRVHYALGQALLDAGRAGEAVPHLRRGFDAGIEVPKGGYDLAVALKEAGDLPGAANVIRRITPPDAGDVEAFLRLGRLASQVRAPEVAEPFFQRAVQLRPGQAGARQQLGLNLLVLGRFEEAARELAEAARLDPGDADSLAHLAFCEARLGRAADARAHAGAALRLDPNHDLAKQLAAALRMP